MKTDCQVSLECQIEKVGGRGWVAGGDGRLCNTCTSGMCISSLLFTPGNS